MSAFYSILYVPIRPGVQERLTVGLFMRTDEQAYFKYSKSKLSTLKSLLPKPAHGLLKLSLNSIERSVFRATEDLKESKKGLLPDESLHYQIVHESHFEYLSRYNKNLLAFGKPEKIQQEPSFELFQKLFTKYISDDELVNRQETMRIQDIVIRTHDSLKPRIEKRVNWKFKVTQKHLSQLILPSVSIDFIGKNGKYVAGQAVDFEKADWHLNNDMAKFIALTDAMRDENNGSTCFVLGKEPIKELKMQHQLWENIRESARITFVDADDFEVVVDYIEDNDVQPLIPFEKAE